jgi:hypothetical protein
MCLPWEVSSAFSEVVMFSVISDYEREEASRVIEISSASPKPATSIPEVG